MKEAPGHKLEGLECLSFCWPKDETHLLKLLITWVLKWTLYKYCLSYYPAYRYHTCRNPEDAYAFLFLDITDMVIDTNHLLFHMA